MVIYEIYIYVNQYLKKVISIIMNKVVNNRYSNFQVSIFYWNFSVLTCEYNGIPAKDMLYCKKFIKIFIKGRSKYVHWFIVAFTFC